MLEGLMLATEATPVPLKDTDCGLPRALSVITSDAVRLPSAVGEKVTFNVQLLLAATGPLQVFVCAKSPEFAPASTTLLIFKAAFPTLLSVIVWTALVVDKV